MSAPQIQTVAEATTRAVAAVLQGEALSPGEALEGAAAASTGVAPAEEAAAAVSAEALALQEAAAWDAVPEVRHVALEAHHVAQEDLVAAETNGSTKNKKQ
jgi:hypothetical protein